MLNAILTTTTVAIIVWMCFMIYDMCEAYVDRLVEKEKRPRSALPHSFRSSRGHLVDLLECTECNHPEDHPIHGVTKK